jgi:uncharacterized protein YbjQ (UPF0145 family)
MNCPNCGLEQAEGASCVNCRATLPKRLTASEVKTMKAGFERKEKNAPLPPASEPIEFNLKNLEASNKDIEPSIKDFDLGDKDTEASSPGQTKSATLPGIEQFQKVLVTTSSTVEGRKVVRYGDVVGCQAVVKLDGLEKFLEGIKDISSLRNSSYGELFKKAEILLMTDLKIEAAKREADAVIGIAIDYEFGWEKVMMVCASGTVVYLEDAQRSVEVK